MFSGNASRFLLFIVLMAFPACAATLPFEGEVIRDVVGQKQSAACRCEAVCQ
jgi:hypothetical protein